MTLTLTKVNTYGLLYEWKGSDVSLKPLLLTAHQGLSDYVGYFHRLAPLTQLGSADVVPVDAETVGQWTHPPYSGYYDGTIDDWLLCSASDRPFW